MKKIVFALLLLPFALAAQMTSVVDGVTVVLTPQDSAEIKATWEAGRNAMRLDSLEYVQNSALFNTIKNVAQSAVGVRVDSLTNNQRWALVNALFLNVGAIDTGLRVKSLNTWVKRPERP